MSHQSEAPGLFKPEFYVRPKDGVCIGYAEMQTKRPPGHWVPVIYISDMDAYLAAVGDVGMGVHMIVNAYEAGFGHGIQKRDLGNPYSVGTLEFLAWADGYKEGGLRAAVRENLDKPTTDAVKALENVRLFAAKNRAFTWGQTLLRFCAEGGVTSNPLRSQPAFKDECVATGQTCDYGPYGVKGETQCKFCGAAPDDDVEAQRKVFEDKVYSDYFIRGVKKVEGSQWLHPTNTKTKAKLCKQDEDGGYVDKAIDAMWHGWKLATGVAR